MLLLVTKAVICMGDMYEIINALLNERDMNKKELAEKAGIPYSSLISAFNRRSQSFSSSYIQKIAAVLEVSVDEVLGLASEMDESRKTRMYEFLEDSGFTLDFDEGYDLYGKINLNHDELGITAFADERELIELVDSIFADGEKYKDRYVKNRLILELTNEPDNYHGE